MAFTAMTAAPIIAIKDGTRTEFRKLTLRDMGALLAGWIAEERAAILERIDAAGAGQAEKLAELTKLHEAAVERGGPSWAMTQLVRPLRIHETLLYALRKAKPDATDADIDGLGLDYHQLFDLALCVWGASRGDNPDAAPEGDERPKDQAPQPTGA